MAPANALGVEIGLKDHLEEGTISSSTDFRLVNRGTGAVIGDFKALEDVRVMFHKNAIKFVNGYEVLGSYKGPVEMVCFPPEGKKALVSIDNKWYRGTLRLFPAKNKTGLWRKKSNGVTIVNKIDIEDYLKGVVPSEMPASWHREALKVQAVCARTYTLSKLNRRRELGYDLKSTVEDQAYLGYEHEQTSTNLAIDKTKDQIMVDGNGRVVEAYYTSSAGGYTDAIEDIWGLSPKSYIVPRKSFDNNSPHYSWKKKLSQREINEGLADLGIGEILGFTEVSRTQAQRVNKLVVVGSKGRTFITGEEIRHKLGLRSAMFNFGLENGKMVFAGRGFGHGLGMSQYGSKEMAERGYTYKNILEHFYPTTKLVKI